MKTLIFLFIFAVLSPSLFTFANEEDFKIEVEVDPKHYPVEKFRKNKNVKVSAMKKKAELPKKEDRDAAFARVKGLEPFIKDFDEADRDTFYVSAQSMKGDVLKKSYPEIPGKLLAQLQSELKQK